MLWPHSYASALAAIEGVQVPFTAEDIDLLVEVLSTVIRDYTAATVGADLTSIGQRLERLEQQPALKYCGPYRNADSYQPGAFVSKGGSLWLCERPTSGIPGAAR